MKATVLLAAAALLATTACSPLLVGDRDHDHDRDHARAISGFDHGMQPVANAADAGQRAHGWRYFSDPGTVRAVVISPQGDYYLNRGKGLRWVAGAQTAL